VEVLRERGQWRDDEERPDIAAADVLADEEPGLAALAQASVRGVLLLGPRAGRRSLRLVAHAAGSRPEGQARSGYGFDLHARRRMSGSDKAGRERLCRYILRPPLSYDRLECPKCHARMQHIAFITTADAIREILNAVGHPTDSPMVA